MLYRHCCIVKICKSAIIVLKLPKMAGRLAANFVSSNKGGQILLDSDNFEYRKRYKLKENETYWSCRLDKSAKCSVTAITENIDGVDFIKKINGNHTHSSKVVQKRASAVENMYVMHALL